jgi:FkbM family methyltransferase
MSSEEYIRVLLYRAMKTVNNGHMINKVKVAGNTMYLDDMDSLNLAWYRVYEPFETKFALNEIKESDVVLDLGANIGYYTLLFGSQVGPSGKVFAFEPSPMTFKILSKNVESYEKEKKFSNIKINENAVTERNDETITLHICNENYGMNRIYPSTYTKNSSEKIKVKTIKLDNYFHDYPEQINFVKMDMEGSEFGALKGMEEIIHKNKEIRILLEFHPDSIREYGKDPKDVLELLYSYGLTVYHLNKISEEKEIIKPVIATIANSDKLTPILDNFIDLANKDTTNLFCKKTSS